VDSLEERIRRVTSEPVELVEYDPVWPIMFEDEKHHLLDILPHGIIVRVEHFGSTAVPGLAAKPIIDMLVEVTDLRVVREQVAPLLEAEGYEYFWRPTFGEGGEPFCAWFIKRDPETGRRTHHIHMVEADFSAHWDRLLFRDHLIAHPDVAAQYGALKRDLAAALSQDRVRYTAAKTEFIERVTAEARRERRGGLTRLEQIPNVGPAVAAKLRRVDILVPADLVGRDPYALFEEVTARTGERYDPCLLDVFIAATRFMSGEPARPWWTYTPERKARLG